MNTENIGDTDMREHFERLITKFVDLSQQSRELEALKAQVAEVQNRLQELGLTNNGLQAEITQAWDSVRNIEKERDELREAVALRDSQISALQSAHESTVRDYEDRLANANAAIGARDGTITDLTNQLQLAVAYSSEQETRANNLDRGLTHWRDQAELREAERNNALSANADLTRQVSDLTAQLRDMEAKLARVRSIFEPVAAPVPLTVAS